MPARRDPSPAPIALPDNGFVIGGAGDCRWPRDHIDFGSRCARRIKRRDRLVAKILFVMTATSFWTLSDGTRHPTGYWAEEFAAPYSTLSGAGHEVVVATPGGV